MAEDKETAHQQDTLVCPRDAGKLYFKDVCETVFRTSKHRPWCRRCPHFTSAAGTETPQKNESVPGEAKHQPCG